MRGARITTAGLTLVMVLALGACASGSEPVPPPPGVGFDYQLGGDYPLPDGAGLVVRQWSGGEAAAGAYSVCYVNAFQTEAEPGHPDSATNWPDGLVLERLEDPEWPGEHPINIDSDQLRRTAVEFIQQRFTECQAQGFDAVELDNLDTFTRYPDAPFDRDDAIAYARLLVAEAADLGLAVGQKNTPELLDVARTEIGFEFAIVEQCGEYDECQQFVDTYGGRVFDVEYTDTGLVAACEVIGEVAGVVQRDLDLVAPSEVGYLHETC
ncbi:endo alpha-1,4 polygalactosaminidase [Pseudactinotalea sp.]|uniref:endo alpha-1,4 polygalactosaminidase n=1 Tax=Pseudactinotalea sp. TaxID=1926260 RepID=UPI003B3B15DA